MGKDWSMGIKIQLDRVATAQEITIMYHKSHKSRQNILNVLIMKKIDDWGDKYVYTDVTLLVEVLRHINNTMNKRLFLFKKILVFLVHPPCSFCKRHILRVYINQEVWLLKCWRGEFDLKMKPRWSTRWN